MRIILVISASFRGKKDECDEKIAIKEASYSPRFHTVPGRRKRFASMKKESIHSFLKSIMMICYGGTVAAVFTNPFIICLIALSIFQLKCLYW